MGCYFCGNEVTGVEHIPPKSFFPKGKRQDLITIPSCDKHNQEKSKEDEYIRSILLASIKLDDQEHMETLRETNIRALERSANRAFEKLPTIEQAQEALRIIDKFKDDAVGQSKAIAEIASRGIMSFGLLGLLKKDIREEIVRDICGNKTRTTSFVYDEERFNAFFECMARGIFFMS